MEAELHRQYRELREKGLKVKAWWFEAKSKELIKEMYPEVEFKFSDGWFTAFEKRNQSGITQQQMSASRHLVIFNTKSKSFISTGS